MKAHYLGHVVFYVNDLQRSLAFYRDLLGFREVGRIFNGMAAALTSGRTHHELLLIQVGEAPGPLQGRRRSPGNAEMPDQSGLAVARMRIRRNPMVAQIPEQPRWLEGSSRLRANITHPTHVTATVDALSMTTKVHIAP